MQTQPSERLMQRDGLNGEPARGQVEAMIIGMYHEMPGLSLHLAQAVRLFGLQTATCQIVLDQFVQQGVLRRAHDGQYLRADGSR